MAYRLSVVRPATRAVAGLSVACTDVDTHIDTFDDTHTNTEADTGTYGGDP